MHQFFLTGCSKDSIYNKIKLKEIEKYVVKNKGITYISDEGINLNLNRYQIFSPCIIGYLVPVLGLDKIFIMFMVW